MEWRYTDAVLTHFFLRILNVIFPRVLQGRIGIYSATSVAPHCSSIRFPLAVRRSISDVPAIFLRQSMSYAEKPTSLSSTFSADFATEVTRNVFENVSKGFLTYLDVVRT